MPACLWKLNDAHKAPDEDGYSKGSCMSAHRNTSVRHGDTSADAFFQVAHPTKKRYITTIKIQIQIRITIKIKIKIKTRPKVVDRGGGGKSNGQWSSRLRNLGSGGSRKPSQGLKIAETRKRSRGPLRKVDESLHTANGSLPLAPAPPPFSSLQARVDSQIVPGKRGPPLAVSPVHQVTANQRWENLLRTPVAFHPSYRHAHSSCATKILDAEL
ncbi:MAG: hypothetical protein LQ347_004556 [Umbilicaria vellea]|nr:MAG: hypothetical protein LQ347_004556 [Umbilicaria vellea]